MKYTMTQLVLQYQSDEPKTLYADEGRIIFGLNHPSISFYDRKSELERIDSFKEQILIHLIMIYKPEKGYESDTQSKEELVNKWMIPIARSIKRSRLSPNNIDSDFTKECRARIIRTLDTKHNWKKVLNWDEEDLEIIYHAFLTCIYMEVAESKHKRSEFNIDQFYKALDKFLNSLKNSGF